jgi:hypothetical protein
MMTPERWERIDELFAATLRIDPAERYVWLRAACGDDEKLLALVVRLIDQAEQASRERLLTAPANKNPAAGATGSWHSHSGHSAQHGPEPENHAAITPLASTSGLSPWPTLATGHRPHAISETESVVRARLRELPLIHILLLVMAAFWKIKIIGFNESVLWQIDAFCIAFLAALIAVLWSRWRLPLVWLQALELSMVAVLAMRLAVVEYRLVLFASLREDSMMAQFVLKNVILLTAILIPSFGLYVPKTWRRAALVGVPLACLPFATLLVLFLRHPQAMSWLGKGYRESTTPRLLLFSFDAMVLLILVVASAFGARAISLLRRQIAEAKQLGPYRLGRRLGIGGMGEVYLAEHQLLKRPCAVKLIHPDKMADARALARFEREVRLTATLSHPNTVEIYDYGQTEDGTYYYVMEYLPGLSLLELVERHGPLPPGRVVYLLRQVCQALREAHGSGLIHRDIKPSNISVSRRGGLDDVAKLLDFGLVLPVARPGVPQISRENQVLGTPEFMSPEQASARGEIDGRSDIYSLGAVAYYLLTGRPPFEGEHGIGLLIAHARDPVVPPSLVHANIPRDLESIILRCLAKAPADRFPDAESLEIAFGKCACAEDWDQGRAALWWLTSFRARGRARGSTGVVSAGS